MKIIIPYMVKHHKPNDYAIQTTVQFPVDVEAGQLLPQLDKPDISFVDLLEQSLTNNQDE